MSAGRTRIAALIDYADHSLGGGSTQLLHGIESECERLGFDLLVVVGRSLELPPHSRIYDLVRAESADAVILIAEGLSAVSGSVGLAQFAAQLAPLPLCSIGMELPAVPSVTVDDRAGIFACVRHLFEQHARRKLAFISGPEQHAESSQRLADFRAALEQFGLAFDPGRVICAALTESSGGNAALSLYERGLNFDGIVTINDAVALGAMEALRARGVLVPDEISVTGFDDSPSSRFAHPPLTTARQPLEALGAQAVELLRRQLSGAQVPLSTRLPATLVRRRSCGCELRRGQRVRYATTAASASETHSALDTASVAGALLRAQHDALSSALEAARRLPGTPGSWVAPLLSALEAELAGAHGSFESGLEELLESAGQRQRDAHEEIEQALSIVRERLTEADPGRELDSLWLHAQRVVAAAGSAEQLRQKLATETAYWRLLRSGERFSTALTLNSLTSALADELPQVTNSAFIALFEPGQPELLRPVFCLDEGLPFEAPEQTFRAVELTPRELRKSARRRTEFALSLTFEGESLGVLVLELGNLAVLELLRAQISTALKGVALHQEIVEKTAQNERSVQERLATARRMSALSVLAGGVAHDLNNALGPLVALPDVILRDLRDDNPELRTDLHTIKTAALRASQTIKDLLALGRQGRTRRDPMDLNLAIRQFLETEAALPLRNVSPDFGFEWQSEDGELVVRVSEQQFIRALSNLLRNAHEALQGQGQVRLLTSRVQLHEALAGYETVPPGDYAVVRVVDDGPGILPSDREHIFEPFFTRKELSDTSGSGLGLAIVHGVVKEHEGFVDVHTELGRGTCFSLYFPLAAEAPKPRSIPVVARNGTARILVVDDDPVQLRTARRVLERFGYQVSTARGGHSARQLFDEKVSPGGERKPFDLVVVDMILNEAEDGLAVFEQLRELQPNQRGIVVSGHAPSERAKRAVEQGLRWLSKPYTAESIAELVEAALKDRGAQRSSAMEDPFEAITREYQ